MYLTCNHCASALYVSIASLTSRNIITQHLINMSAFFSLQSQTPACGHDKNCMHSKKTEAVQMMIGEDTWRLCVLTGQFLCNNYKFDNDLYNERNPFVQQLYRQYGPVILMNRRRLDGPDGPKSWLRAQCLWRGLPASDNVLEMRNTLRDNQWITESPPSIYVIRDLLSED